MPMGEGKHVDYYHNAWSISIRYRKTYKKMISFRFGLINLSS